jgi:hypothetical protein
MAQNRSLTTHVLRALRRARADPGASDMPGNIVNLRGKSRSGWISDGRIVIATAKLI